jgi:DNA polymerase-3 subunit gamma/tau
VFSQEELTRAWDAFAETIKTEYPRMYSTIKNNAPDYKDDFKLNFSLNNKGQEEEFTVRIKPILLNYLRKELNNYTIDIVVNFAHDGSNEKKNMYYTAEDKFQYLSEKNPILAKLKQQFNLDFE